MQLYVLREEPIAVRQLARIDAEHTEDARYGDGPRCEACGHEVGMLAWLPPYRIEIETRGTAYGDFARLSDQAIVSGGFKEAWEQAQLKGLSGWHKVSVAKHRRRRRAMGKVPTYFYVIVARSTATIDQKASGFEWEVAPTCAVCRLGQIAFVKRVRLEPRSWGGEDLFVARGLPGTIIATERVKRLCEDSDLKGVHLVPAENWHLDFR